jgi:hypothetical protein
MQWGTVSIPGSIAVAAGAPMAAQADGPRLNRGKVTGDVDTPSVRSHVIESVRLHGRLMADGSILTRAPAP